MLLVNLEHDFSIVESPDPFGAGASIPIDKHRAEKGSGYASNGPVLGQNRKGGGGLQPQRTSFPGSAPGVLLHVNIITEMKICCKK